METLKELREKSATAFTAAKVLATEWQGKVMPADIEEKYQRLVDESSGALEQADAMQRQSTAHQRMAAIEAAPKDAAQERAKSVDTILRHQEDLRLRRKQINDLRHLAGLPANDEFMDAETAKV